MPGKFTCQGEDINPGLIIEDIPEGAESLALIVDDPDAPISYVKPVKVRDDSFTIATSSQNIVVFDKIDSYRVRHQATREASDGIFVVKRKRRVTYTTVTIGLDEAWEIFWEEPKKN